MTEITEIQCVNGLKTTRMDYEVIVSPIVVELPLCMTLAVSEEFKELCKLNPHLNFKIEITQQQTKLVIEFKNCSNDNV